MFRNTNYSVPIPPPINRYASPRGFSLYSEPLSKVNLLRLIQISIIDKCGCLPEFYTESVCPAPEHDTPLCEFSMLSSPPLLLSSSPPSPIKVLAGFISIELGHNYTFFGITSGLCLMTISQFAGDM